MMESSINSITASIFEKAKNLFGYVSSIMVISLLLDDSITL